MIARRPALLAFAVGALLAGGDGALAFVTGDGTGTGSGAVGTISAPAVTVPVSSTGTVAVGWTPATITPSSLALEALIAYTVERSPDGGSTWAPAAGTCAGSLPAGTANCSDDVQVSGTYDYRVQASFRTWTATGTSAGPVSVNQLTAPAITAGPSSPSASTGPSFSFSGGGGTGFECRIDAGPYAACTSPYAASGLTDGPHTFYARATQGALNGPAGTALWTIDASAPSLSSTAANPSASQAATFTFTHPAYATLRCRIDGGAFNPCTSPRAYGALADGSHTFEVQAIDGDGAATAAATSAWTIRTAAPAITAAPPNPTSQTGATFSFDSPGFPAYQCRLDTGAFAACDAGTVSYAGLSVASHTFTVRAIDGAGIASLDATFTWTVTPAPVLGFGSCDSGGGRRNRFIGTTTVNTGTVTVTVYAGAGTGGPIAATLTDTTFTGGAPPFGWRVTTANRQLTGGATYTAQATQVDATGGSGNAPTCTFVAN